MLIMFGLYNVAGCSYWISSAVNYIAASILSYVLNRKFTFSYGGTVFGSGIRFACNIAVCYLAAYGAAKPAMAWMLQGYSRTVQDNMAMLMGMCIFTGLNYLGQRCFVFKERKMEYKKIYEEWMNSPYVNESEKQQLKAMTEEEIYEAFYKYAEFGTAGMRGIMGLGTNRLNTYTIRMASKGLAELLGDGAKVAIAYDTRNHSREFAEESAKVLAAAGIEALLFDRCSPVPLLSFAVRELECDGGIVITASHNTKEYNGFKVFDSTGSQMGTEDAGKIADNISRLTDGLAIEAAELAHENIHMIGEDITERFLEAVGKCVTAAGADDSGKNAAAALKVAYTSLHGSGRDYVMEALKRAGFTDVSLVKEQADYDGDFPTVAKPNPEDHAAFAIAEKLAFAEGADILIGTDPDCDRIGVGVRQGDAITYLSGNQIGALLIDYLAQAGDCKGKTMITTIVTGEMGPMAAESHGLQVVKTLTGFKNIGSVMNGMKAGEFFMGYEESYGYLVGPHARDKDAVSAALAICEMAAHYKKQGITLIDALHEIFARQGHWIDQQESFTFEGSEGEKKIKRIMELLKEQGEKVFSEAGEVRQAIDYNEGVDGLPSANVFKYIFTGGSWVAARPSGTEPKIKFYYCVTGKDEAEAEAFLMGMKKCVQALVVDLAGVS